MERLPVRCYDNGGKTADRYTVVYTKAYRVWPQGHKWYGYIGMSEAPCHPQGFCQHGESESLPIDRPNGKHLGKRIKHNLLPHDCIMVILKDLDQSN